MSFGHLAGGSGGRDDARVFWRRREPVPEPEISHDEVIEIFVALSNIKKNTLDILAILSEEDDDEREAP